MIAIGDNSSAKKLAECITIWSDRHWSQFRSDRGKMLTEFAGPWFGARSGGGGEPSSRGPLNLIYAMCGIFLPALALTPQPRVTTHWLGYRADADRAELAVRFLLDLCGAEDAYRTAILSALFGRGAVLTTIGPPQRGGQIDPDGYLTEQALPTVCHVHEVDLIEDGAADTPGSVSFRGHRFRVPYGWAMDTGLYDRAEIERLHAQQAKPFGREAEQQDKLRFVDEIELASIWLPRHEAIVTLPGDMTAATKYLREDEYRGPETGPLDILTFMGSPDSTMPVPAVGIVFDLALAISELAARLIDRAIAKRDVPVVRPGAEKMALALMQARGTEYIVGDPASMGMAKFGGPDAADYEALAWLQRHLNSIAGNPEILGGLSSQAGTLGQDQILQTNAQATLADKRRRVKRMVGSSVGKIAWQLWHGTGPLTMPLVLHDEGFGDIQTQWSPARMPAGRFDDYIFDVEGYSARADDPAGQYAQMVDWLTRVIMPLAQIGALQGQGVDVAQIAAITGGLLDLPDAADLFRPMGAVQGAAPQVSPPQPSGPQITINQGRRPSAMGAGRPQEAPDMRGVQQMEMAQ